LRRAEENAVPGKGKNRRVPHCMLPIRRDSSTRSDAYRRYPKFSRLMPVWPSFADNEDHSRTAPNCIIGGGYHVARSGPDYQTDAIETRHERFRTLSSPDRYPYLVTSTSSKVVLCLLQRYDHSATII
jgi:hypothetical protein